jgi:hypothetical protein
MDPNNADRAAWALIALQAFSDECGPPLDNEGDRDAAIGDLLCDLMHYCNQHGIDFDDRLKSGKFHFEYEIDPANADECNITMEEQYE